MERQKALSDKIHPENCYHLEFEHNDGLYEYDFNNNYIKMFELFFYSMQEHEYQRKVRLFLRLL